MSKSNIKTKKLAVQLASVIPLAGSFVDESTWLKDMPYALKPKD